MSPTGRARGQPLDHEAVLAAEVNDAASREPEETHSPGVAGGGGGPEGANRLGRVEVLAEDATVPAARAEVSPPRDVSRDRRNEGDLKVAELAARAVGSLGEADVRIGDGLSGRTRRAVGHEPLDSGAHEVLLSELERLADQRYLGRIHRACQKSPCSARTRATDSAIAR